MSGIEIRGYGRLVAGLLLLSSMSGCVGIPQRQPAEVRETMGEVEKAGAHAPVARSRDIPLPAAGTVQLGEHRLILLPSPGPGMSPIRLYLPTRPRL